MVSRRATGMLVQKDPGSQFDAEDSRAPGGGLGARGSNPGLAALGTWCKTSCCLMTTAAAERR